MVRHYSLDISYNKKRTYKSKRYTILIPDDAVLQTNIEGIMGLNRDFTAFLSHNKNDSWDLAPVSFSSAGDSHTSDGTALTAEQAYQYFETVTSRVAAMTGDETTTFRYSHGKIRGAICHQKISDDCSNFHIWAGEDGHMYQFRVIFNVELPDSQMLELVTGWMDTMELTDSSPKIEYSTAETKDFLKNQIMQFFSKQGSKYFTITEICEDYRFSEISNQKMTSVLKTLEDEGFLIRKIEKKKSYFANRQYVLEEEKRAVESELKEAKENLSRCQKKLDSIPELEKQLEEMKSKNFTEIKAAMDVADAAKQAYDSCVEQKNEVQRELESLEFFAFGKKKQAKARIEQLDSEAASLNVAMVDAQSDLKKIEQRLKANEMSLQNKIEQIRTNFSAAQKRVAAAEEKLESLKM